MVGAFRSLAKGPQICKIFRNRRLCSLDRRYKNVEAVHLTDAGVSIEGANAYSLLRHFTCDKNSRPCA